MEAHFIPEQTYTQVDKGHGRLEKRTVSICQSLEGIRPRQGLETLIRVDSMRQLSKGGLIETSTETRYYISSLIAPADELQERIRGYWGVENKVHYVRDVTQGEDQSRIRTTPLPQIFALARNLALNLYRTRGFTNMAQAQRYCSNTLDTLTSIFRMK